MALPDILFVSTIVSLVSLRIAFREKPETMVNPELAGSQAGPESRAGTKTGPDTAFSRTRPAARKPGKKITLKYVFHMIVALVILSLALYIILSRKFDKDAEKWAFGTIGLVFGNAIGFISK